jgi:hypothetical protein
MSDYVSQPTMNLRWISRSNVSNKQSGNRLGYKETDLQQEFILRSIEDGSVTSEWRDIPTAK